MFYMHTNQKPVRCQNYSRQELGTQASTNCTQTLLQHADLVRALGAAEQYAKRAQRLLDLEAPKSPFTVVSFDILLTTAA